MCYAYASTLSNKDGLMNYPKVFYLKAACGMLIFLVLFSSRSCNAVYCNMIPSSNAT